MIYLYIVEKLAFLLFIQVDNVNSAVRKGDIYGFLVFEFLKKLIISHTKKTQNILTFF